MKTIVFSCKYSKILPFFAKLFNKYWSTEQEVIVLSPFPETIDSLPDNFSIAKLDNFTKNWAEDLQPFFDEFKEPYFHACMEDHFLYAPVNLDVINKARQYIEDGSIIKFGFQIGPDRHGVKTFRDTEFMQLTSACPLHSSLQPAIWHTEFFKYMLEKSKGMDPWQFEVLNQKNTKLICDSYNIIYKPTLPDPYPVLDLIRNGKRNDKFWKPRITIEDLDTFNDATSVFLGR